MRLLILAIVVSLLVGCSTVVSGPNKDILVDSKPRSALVSAPNGEKCLTPCVLSMRRHGTPSILISKDGYEDESFIFYRELNPWIFGNIVFWLPYGAIGAAIDGISGAAIELYPSSVFVTLEEE